MQVKYNTSYSLSMALWVSICNFWVRCSLQPHQRNSCFNHELHSHWKTYVHLWKLHTLSITSEIFLPINCVSLIFFTNHCRALKTFICKGPRVTCRSDKKGKTERKLYSFFYSFTKANLACDISTSLWGKPLVFIILLESLEIHVSSKGKNAHK